MPARCWRCLALLTQLPARCWLSQLTFVSARRANLNVFFDTECRIEAVVAPLPSHRVDVAGGRLHGLRWVSRISTLRQRVPGVSRLTSRCRFNALASAVSSTAADSHLCVEGCLPAAAADARWRCGIHAAPR